MITPRQSNGYRSADHCGCGQRSKVPTVERVHGLPIHDKDIAIGNDVASVPGRKRMASSVAFLCLAHIDPIDSDL